MRLSIPKPCHENWNEMTPNEQGSFCNVCAKTVVDFSLMSDEEVLGYFKNKSEEKTCGRFKISQLAPYEFRVDIRKVARGSFPKIFAASMFIFFTSLFVCKSDTGQAMPVKVLVDNVDTANIRLQETFVDTITDVNGQVELAAIDSMAAEIMEHSVLGGVHYSSEEVVDYRQETGIEEMTLTGDTIYSIDAEQVNDTIAVEIPMVTMGLVSIDYKQPQQKPPVCNKKPPKDNRHVKGEMIMGKVAY
jgi:hypothetical protein